MEVRAKLSNISDLYTADTLAEELNVSRSMVYYLRDCGKLKSHQISPTKYVFRKADVKEYLKSEGYAIAE
jgi:excisionase family DNA binding protein